MENYPVYKLYIAKKLLQAGYELDHVTKNYRTGYEGKRVFWFADDGTIDAYVKQLVKNI